MDKAKIQGYKKQDTRIPETNKLPHSNNQTLFWGFGASEDADVHGGNLDIGI
jgi:hypothetical protein